MSLTAPDIHAYQEMLEERKKSITVSWRKGTEFERVRQQYAPELPDDRILSKQEYEKFEENIKAKLAKLDATFANHLLISSWEDMEKLRWQEAYKITDTYGQALYYQAFVADLFAASGAEGLEKKAQTHYVASDLVRFFYFQYSRHKYFAF